MCIRDRIKIDKNRVALAEMDPAATSGDAITGGYLLELDRYFDEVNKFRSAFADLPVNFKEPDEEGLNSAQFNYMKDYFNAVEALLYAPDFPAAGEYELRPYKVQGFSTDAKIYLRDTFTGTRTQITEGGAPYVFTADAPGEYNDRFEIEIDTNRIETGLGDDTARPRYHVITDVQSCIVTGLQGDATVSIYDVAGRQMLRRHTTADSIEATLPAGPYVVTINENGKNYNVKIIVK